MTSKRSQSSSAGGAVGRLRHGIGRWLRRRLPPAPQVELGLRSVFILPNRQGLGFVLVLGLMLLGAINYEASLAYAVVFLLGSLLLLSIFHTWRNLAGLRLSAAPGEPVFAGAEAALHVLLERDDARPREALQLGFSGGGRHWADLVTQPRCRVTLHVPAPRRGWLDPGRLRVETVYPLGICRAWSHVDLAQRCLVYPAPEVFDLRGLLGEGGAAGSTGHRAGDEEFHALRGYRKGDSLSQVAWKALARGRGLHTKQFAAQDGGRRWLDWDLFDGLDREARLSRLCYGVLALEQAGLSYGLRLPGTTIAPGQGPVHKRRVLEALALHGSEDAV